MSYIESVAGLPKEHLSPLVLSDHFLRLAEEADAAGFRIAADHLIHLAMTILDEPATLKH